MPHSTSKFPTDCLKNGAINALNVIFADRAMPVNLQSGIGCDPYIPVQWFSHSPAHSPSSLLHYFLYRNCELLRTISSSWP